MQVAVHLDQGGRFALKPWQSSHTCRVGRSKVTCAIKLIFVCLNSYAEHMKINVQKFEQSY